MPAIPPRLLRNGAGGDAVALFAGSLLLGTSGINSGNGMLQLPTHTAKTGGIGFGVATSFYTSEPGKINVDHVGGSAPHILLRESGVAKAQIATTSGVLYIDSSTAASILIRTNSVVALTLDSSQNATFAAAITVQATSAIKGVRTAVATLDFPSVLANVGTQDLPVTVTGAAVGDVVQLGLPAAPDAGLVWNAWVSAANTVTIRATNISAGAIDPASASYRVTVMSH